MPKIIAIKYLLLLIPAILVAGCALTRPASLTVDGEVIRVSSSDLVWQKERGPLFSSREQANSYVQKLELGGYYDWRLPTREEFLELYFPFDFGSADAKALGIAIEGNYWSAEKDGYGFSGAWKDGDSCEISRNYKPAPSGYVRAVRP